MENEATQKSAKTDHLPEHFGILLGWTADELESRIVLCMQSAQHRPHSSSDVERFRYFLDKKQAALLGNFLMRMSGETAPKPPPRGLFSWFGKPRD